MVIFSVKQKINERPPIWPQRHYVAGGRVELHVPVVVHTSSQHVHAILGPVFGQSIINTRFIRPTDDQVGIVVPRYATVMSIRPQQRSAGHEIGRVDPIQGLDENDYSLPEQGDIGVGHGRNEEGLDGEDGQRMSLVSEYAGSDNEKSR